MWQFGKVETRFWTNPETSSFSDKEKLLFLYLLTCPHGNTLGCFNVPDGYVAADLGWNMETVQACFLTLTEKGFISRGADGWILIRNFAKFNGPTNTNQGKNRATLFSQTPKQVSIYKALVREMLRFPDYLPQDFIDHLETLDQELSNHSETLSKPFTNGSETLSESLPEPLRNKEIRIKKEIKKENTREADSEPAPADADASLSFPLDQNRVKKPDPDPMPEPPLIPDQDQDPIKNQAQEAPGGDDEFYLTRRKRKLRGWKLRAFGDFWEAFGLPKGKAAAADSWLDIPSLTQELVKTEIIPAAKAEAVRREKAGKDGPSPKWAQGWLTERRWEDEVYQSNRKHPPKERQLTPEEKRQREVMAQMQADLARNRSGEAMI